ncbi:uncharacterized protein LOC120343245 [Styela clava]
MRLEEYSTIFDFINYHKSNCPRTVLSNVISNFGSQYQYHTLMSIFLTCLQRKVKMTYHSKMKEEKLKYYYKLYKERMNISHQMNHKQNVVKSNKLPAQNIEQTSSEIAKLCNGKEAVSNGTDSGSSDVNGKSVLIGIANDFEIPPCLMARIIVEQYLIEEKASANNKENFATGTVIGNRKNQNVTQETTVASLKMENINNEQVQKTVDLARVDGTKYSPFPASRIGLSNKSKPDVSFPPMSNHQSSTQSMPTSKPPSTSSVSQTSIKNKVSSWMNDPFLIPDEKLREQVLHCISFDVCYGPINDAIRHSVGLEFEEKLVRNVKRHNLPFLDENDLRKRGYDKTPDVKLEVPISVNGYPVCWIESKASFGDLQTHSEYLRDQYYSYWNRFGPGIVIYWFGFIDGISDEMKKLGILVMDDFPSDKQISFMNP